MMASLSRIAAVLAMAISLAACDRGSHLTAPIPKADNPEPVASRVMVLAGDTLIIDGQHVQLSNAVAPQGIPDARCWAEAVAAKHAIQYVKGLLRDSRNIRIQPTGQLDGYGRTLALVSLDGLDLGTLLYDNGDAAQPKDGSFRWCDQISRELDGGPRWGSMSEPGR